MTTWRRRLRRAAALTAVVSLVPGTALASWIGAGTGTGAGEADAVPTGAAPTVSVTGRNVTVSWTSVAFADGTPITDYRVARYEVGSGTADTVGAACAGTISALTCTEAAAPSGNWRYAVTPVRAGWTGPEGPTSPVVVVGTPAFSFTSSATITSLPSTRAGTVSDYVTGSTVAFHLDGVAGPALTGSTAPDPIPANGGASTSVTIPVGTTDGVHDVVAVGSDGSVASATVTIDRTAPVVSAATIAKSQGGRDGFVKQAGTYRVYANVADAVSSVSTVTANVSTVTTGVAATPLSAGSWTVDGVTYGYRSAQLTASNPLAAGAKAFSVAATDSVGNAGTTTGFSVTVDNTRPSASDVQTGGGGATPGKAETGDTVTFTYGEAIEPSSILAGWDGSATSVTVQLIQAGGQDRLQVWNAGNTAQLPLGQIRLGRTDFTTADVDFTGSSMSASGGAVTIVLGTPSGATTTAAGTGTMTWTPSTTATDLAANTCQNTNRTETGAADLDF